MTDLHWKSAAKLVKGYAKKKFSPVEVANACLAQIARHDTQLNAMVAVHAEEAMAQARASEKRWMKAEPQGPVDGVPTLIKDLLLVREAGGFVADPDGDKNPMDTGNILATNADLLPQFKDALSKARET